VAHKITSFVARQSAADPRRWILPSRDIPARVAGPAVPEKTEGNSRFPFTLLRFRHWLARRNALDK